ncbi:hypothetical protein ABIA16_002564 [Sinorhizobium fredii]
MSVARLRDSTALELHAPSAKTDFNPRESTTKVHTRTVVKEPKVTKGNSVAYKLRDMLSLEAEPGMAQPRSCSRSELWRCAGRCR